MSIDLPKGRSTFFPEMPSELGRNSSLYLHLQSLQEEMTKQVSGLFDNDTLIRDTLQNIIAELDLGVSGSFVSSEGKTITVTLGIITGIA